VNRVTDHFDRIDNPELIIGFVAPIGTDLRGSIRTFAQYFKNAGYNVIELKVTDIFRRLALHLKPEQPLRSKPEEARLQSYISYGNQIRRFFDDDQILAALTLVRIVQKRAKRGDQTKPARPENTAYIIHQFKRKEEIDLLRSVYGRTFFQVSVYSRRGARVDYLSRKFAQGENSGNPNSYRSKAEEIVQRDENELDEVHGQRVSRIFHDGDVIINSDLNEENVREQVTRFCDLLFGSNKISPTKIEYGMFAAKAAALRTLDLSRQVGAAIFSPQGEIISMGSNEVPKGLGGTYWSDDPNKFDDRDYCRGYDANDRRKRELLSELLQIAGVSNADDLLKKGEIQNSQFMDALEYGRVIHAEMSAICDAARLGRSVQGATLFSSTFPCHMCAKHIVAAGIARVIFLEPYPKSLTAHFHSDSVSIEESDKGKYSSYPCVEFAHFHGVSPRRYRELFERGRRKNGDGTFYEWKDNIKRPIVDLKFPFYMNLEAAVLKAATAYLETLKLSVEELSKTDFVEGGNK
jgi:deoxycytidylate deaminase